MNDTPSSCEFPLPSMKTPTGSRIMRFQEGFHWQDTAVAEYKAPADHWCGIQRRVFIGDRGEQTQFEMRYFEIAPGGYSSLESHQHEHAVFVLRGSGEVQLGEENHRVTYGDVVYVAPNETHQFRNESETEPFGFLCVVDAERDKPTAQRAHD